MIDKVEEIVRREINHSHQREQEYWGPLTHDFSDAFLMMVDEMLRNFFSRKDIKIYKAGFTAVTELVQNIAEYNAQNFSGVDPQTLFNLSLENQFLQIKCSNQILAKDVNPITERFVQLERLHKEERYEKYKNALLSGDSLGLLIIYRLEDVSIKWSIKKEKDQIFWLNIYVKLNYASFRN